jgi:hypothetical protein
MIDFNSISDDTTINVRLRHPVGLNAKERT